jgi:hypothetical protein
MRLRYYILILTFMSWSIFSCNTQKGIHHKHDAQVKKEKEKKKAITEKKSKKTKKKINYPF